MTQNRTRALPPAHPLDPPTGDEAMNALIDTTFPLTHEPYTLGTRVLVSAGTVVDGLYATGQVLAGVVIGVDTSDGLHYDVELDAGRMANDVPAQHVRLAPEPGPESHLDQGRADAIAAGLRQLADMIAANPQLVQHVEFTSLANRDVNINIPVNIAPDPRGAIVEFAGAALRHGAPVTKEMGDEYGGIVARFGETSLHVYASKRYFDDTPGGTA